MSMRCRAHDALIRCACVSSAAGVSLQLSAHCVQQSSLHVGGAASCSLGGKRCGCHGVFPVCQLCVGLSAVREKESSELRGMERSSSPCEKVWQRLAQDSLGVYFFVV